jgi:hypothetical protein
MKIEIPAAWTLPKQAGQDITASRQSPSRRRFIEERQKKATLRPAAYLAEQRQRIESLTATLAFTGRMSHAKRARLANQLKQAQANLDGHKPAPKKDDRN